MLGFDRTKSPPIRIRTFSFAAVATAALTVFATACGEAPTAPNAAPASSLISTVSTTLTGTLTSVTGLLWTKPVSQATASAVIGPAGGSISIPNGVRLIVPKGAVMTNVTFSVTRLPGIIVAYDFQPHGRFAQPLTIQQPTLGTNLFKLDPVTSLQGAYFPGLSALNQLIGSANVSEFEPTFVSADKEWITFTVKHFSGYMIATGRSAPE